MPDFSDKKFDYVNILNDMLKMVPSELDKREGSVIWTTLAPNAMVLSQLYDLMKNNQSNQYADTADRESLIRLCKTRGITPYPATPTEISAKFYSDMVSHKPYDPTSGDTFYVQDTNLLFVVTSQITTGEWKLKCTTPGEIGNTAVGRLIPTEDMGNFAGAEIKEILIYGANEESDESIRKRYVKSFDTKPYAGNKAFYRSYAEQIPGVGGAKIYRAYQGKGGHVGVCIINAQGGLPSSELIGIVQNKIDPPYAHGEGVGIAPIDHIVTVFSAAEKTLNITMTLMCTKGTTWSQIQPSVIQAINDYLKELSMTWADEKALIVRNAKIQASILEIPNVLDISNFTINGSAGSIQLKDNEIPKLGTVTGTVV